MERLLLKLCHLVNTMGILKEIWWYVFFFFVFHLNKSENMMFFFSEDSYLYSGQNGHLIRFDLIFFFLFDWNYFHFSYNSLTEFFNLSIYREQQLLNVFEVVVSTLEGKLQRIDNLDKAVEHLMRRVEQLDNRVGDNIHKTESIISKLRNLDNKISVETNT